MLLKNPSVMPFVKNLGVQWCRLPQSTSYPRILMYHNVSESTKSNKLDKWRICPNQFESHMAYLADNHWNSVTMSELMCGETMPNQTVAITFDDGFANVYDYAMPVLKKYGLKSTHYLLTDHQSNDWDVSDTSEQDNLLSSQQIDSMLATELVEIGVHGRSHHSLTTLPYSQLLSELQYAKHTLEQTYGITCQSLAYPFGQWHGGVIQAAKFCGFDHAVAVENKIYHPKRDHRFAIPRLTMDGRRGGDMWFRLKLSRG